MNPPDGQPPHLLVIEYVDLEDIAESEMYVQCPFEQLQIRTRREWKPMDMIRVIGDDPDGEDEWKAGEPYPSQCSEWYFHHEQHYCTYRTDPAFEAEIEPVLSFYSRWVKDTCEEVCGRIEVGRHMNVFGGCSYDDLIAANGLFYNLGFGDDHRLTWPKEIPKEPGEYPIFYWQDGYRDSFCNGLTTVPHG